MNFIANELKRGRTWAIVGFVALLIWATATYAHESPLNDHSLTVGLTYGTLAADGYITQRLGYQYNDQWHVSYERTGGDGGVNHTNSIGVFRKVDTTHLGAFGTPFIGIGARYFEDQLLDPDRRDGRVLISENLTYELGVGTSWELSDAARIELGWLHNSTSGRSSRNNGFDRITLEMVWRL